MLSTDVQSFIQQSLDVTSLQVTTIGGGSINDTYRLQTANGIFFCKVNQRANHPGMFEAEQQGLELLAKQQVIRIPQVIANGHTDTHQVLILEWIEQGLKSDAFWKSFGEQLAALHHMHNDQFGLDTDNYMGSLPQYNQTFDNWVDFFIHQRLQPQIELALRNRLLEPAQAAQFEKLYQRLGVIYPGEPASLVHGDLWSGNFLCDDKGKPVLVDPAVAYGHRSVDMALTTLFGGFDNLFYQTYHYHYPLSQNYREQWAVCNLYPLLIHLNLFGKSYLADILNTIRRY